jgi:outer membrane immunogenic protein
MKRIPLTTVALGVLALRTPALAADLAVKAPVAPPVYDWSGFYIGGFGGYAFGNHNLNNALGPAGFANFTVNWESHGPFGGGEIGYNLQSGNLIFGIEADGAATNIQGRDNFALTNVNGAGIEDAKS